MKTIKNELSPQEKTLKTERWLGIFAILTILIAWFVGGAIKNGSVDSYLEQAYPTANTFEELSSSIFAAKDTGGEIIGYVGIDEANGYGGPMRMAVAVDLTGQVIGVALVDNKETPSYLYKVFQTDFVEKLLGKTYDQPFELGNDIDGVTSATYTSTGIANAIRQATVDIAGEQLNLPVSSESRPKIVFGLPEISLIALFAVGFLGRKRVIKNTKLLRWGTMITGMILLGFIYNRPLTLSKINMFLMGYFPEWHTNLYWYLLLGGILFVFTADNRNPYCEWFCPFGAMQECMGAIGGAKSRVSRDQQKIIDWVQRGMAWLAIVIALLLRNPGVTSYEIFGTIFQLNGSTISFAVLGIVLIVSLFSHRFWCRALCPIRPVEGFIRLVRSWIIELWKTNKTKIEAKKS